MLLRLFMSCSKHIAYLFSEADQCSPSNLEARKIEMAEYRTYTALLMFLMQLASSQGFFASPTCPSSETIYPCTCKLTLDGANVVCAGLPSYEIFHRSLQSMKGYKFDTFILKESNIQVLPSNAFSGLQIRSLQIAFVQPSSIDIGPGPAFTGLEDSLEELEIRDSFRFGKAPLPRFELSRFRKLVSLTLESVEIPEIDNEYFTNASSGLEKLHLRNTFTKSFGKRAFASLINLKELSIYQESLKNLTRDMLPRSASKLTKLVLSNNHLTSLPFGVFHGLPSLQTVHIDFNALSTIDSKIWSPIWPQLREVYFYGNPIHCDSSLKWIYMQRLPNVFQGICANPPHLRHRELKSLTLDDLQ